jgi:hypothetical protein
MLFWLPMQTVAWALARALPKAGSSIEARTAMIAITTNNSIKVKKQRLDILFLLAGGRGTKLQKIHGLAL